MKHNDCRDYKFTEHSAPEFRKPTPHPPPTSGSNAVKSPRELIVTYKGIPLENLSQPKDGDIVCMRFIYGGEIDFKTIEAIYHCIERDFDGHKVIALPQDVDLQYLNKEALVQCRDMIDKILEEIKDEN